MTDRTSPNLWLGMICGVLAGVGYSLTNVCLRSLTGLDPNDLRSRLTEPSVLAACLLFLEQYEPDLVACAAAIDAKPEALVRARHELENS